MPPQGEAYVADLPFGPLLDSPTLAERIAEPLLESAPLAFKTAMAHCPHDSACQAYHAIWQYLRLADLARSVRVDGPIYVAVAERLARAGRLRRVLITATADYSMLAHLAYGTRLAGAQVEFTILDRCASSLRLNEWYAERHGLDVRTFQADVLEHEDHGQYDLICTHTLLTRLAPADRGHLFTQWRTWLAHDGRICFSNRLWNQHLHLTQQELDRGSAEMAKKALQILDRNGIPLPCPAEDFAKFVVRYGHRSDDRPPLPLSDVERWVQNADLAIEIAVPVSKVVPRVVDKAPGPFPTDRGQRMWLQLRRA
jgi:hypothetical protein